MDLFGPGRLRPLTSRMTKPQGNGSIIPCLALRGVAAAIARSGSLRAKVLFREPESRSCDNVLMSKELQ